MNIIFTNPAIGKGGFLDTRPCQLRVACPDFLPTNFLITYDSSLQALDQTNFCMYKPANRVVVTIGVANGCVLLMPVEAT